MNPEIQTTNSNRQYTYAGLNRLIHQRTRLGILTALNNQTAGLLFVDLKRVCKLTDGNLSRHLTLLQNAGLIEIWKGSKDHKSQTLCKLSSAGREQFIEYLDVLKQVLKDNAPQSTSLDSETRGNTHAAK